MDNMERSGRVADVFLQAGDKYGGGDDEKAVDFLTDFMHWCDVYAVDFEQAVDSARMHYMTETDPVQTMYAEADRLEAEFVREHGGLPEEGDRVILTDACKLQDGRLVGKTGDVVGQGGGRKWLVKLADPPPIPTDGIVHLWPGEFVKLPELDAEALARKALELTTLYLHAYAGELADRRERMTGDEAEHYSTEDIRRIEELIDDVQALAGTYNAMAREACASDSKDTVGWAVVHLTEATGHEPGDNLITEAVVVFDDEDEARKYGRASWYERGEWDCVPVERGPSR